MNQEIPRGTPLWQSPDMPPAKREEENAESGLTLPCMVSYHGKVNYEDLCQQRKHGCRLLFFRRNRPILPCLGMSRRVVCRCELVLGRAMNLTTARLSLIYDCRAEQ